MAKIKQIVAREILNSQGFPTVEVTVVLQNGVVTQASVPTGTSPGTYEAATVHDQDPTRYKGLGVLKCVNSIQSIIAPKLVGMEATKQADIDKIMIDLDTTQNKSRLGSNAMIGVSKAVAKAGAISSVLPLFLYLRSMLKTSVPLHIPIPLFTVMEGGKHGRETNDFQDIFLVPSSSTTYSTALMQATAITSSLHDILKNNNLSSLVGIEGGFGPKTNSAQDLFNLISEAISSTNYRLGFDIFLGLDASASSFYFSGDYKLHEKSMTLNSKSLIEYYLSFINPYHIIYLEDPMAEDDWDGWTNAFSTLSKDVIISSDNATSTNPYRLQIGLDKKAMSAVVVKSPQVGTVTETLAFVEAARAASLKIVASNRGAETNDDFLADFAVAIGADYVRAGGVTRGERIAKYNRLSQISDYLKVIKPQ